MINTLGIVLAIMPVKATSPLISSKPSLPGVQMNKFRMFVVVVAMACFAAGGTEPKRERQTQAMKAAFDVFKLYLADHKGACPASLSAIDADVQGNLHSLIPEYEPDRVMRIRVSAQREIEISGSLVYYYIPDNRLHSANEPLLSVAVEGENKTLVLFCNGDVNASEVVEFPPLERSVTSKPSTAPSSSGKLKR